MKKKIGIVAIDVPHPSANKNDVVVHGKRAAAVTCATELKSFVAHMKKHCTTLEINDPGVSVESQLGCPSERL